MQSLTLQQVTNFPDVFKVSGPLQREIYSKCFILPSTVVVKRSCIDRVNGFNPKRFGTEDIDLWVRLSAFAKFYCWMRPTVRKYVSDHNVSNMSERWLRELIDYHSMCLKSDEYGQLKDIAMKNLRKFFRYSVVYYAKRNQPGKAIALFRKSLVIGFSPKIALYSFVSIFGKWPFLIGEGILRSTKDR